MRQFEELSQLFYPYLPLENVTIDDGTDEGWTIRGSQYVLDHPFLFSEIGNIQYETPYGIEGEINILLLQYEKSRRQ